MESCICMTPTNIVTHNVSVIIVFYIIQLSLKRDINTVFMKLKSHFKDLFAA